MISHDHKCIFIHIPKCAGTTVEMALGHFDGHDGRGGQDHRTIRMIEPLPRFPISRKHHNHLELMRRIKHCLWRKPNPKNDTSVSRQQYRDYFKFTIVRNPWSRAISVYRNVIKDSAHRRQHGVSAGTSFGEFLRKHAGRGMLRPQLDWIIDWRGNVPLDFIGRFENLEEDFRKVAARIGSIDLRFEPAELRPALPTWFDDELNNLIEDVYAEEIDYFGFSPPAASIGVAVTDSTRSGSPGTEERSEQV